MRWFALSLAGVTEFTLTSFIPQSTQDEHTRVSVLPGKEVNTKRPAFGTASERRSHAPQDRGSRDLPDTEFACAGSVGGASLVGLSLVLKCLLSRLV